MATIAENLQILVDNKVDIKEAIERVIAEDNITLRMSAWADLLNAYEDELQAKSSITAFPFQFPITFKPEQTTSKYFPFSLPLTFTPLPIMTSTSNAPVMARLYALHLIPNPDELEKADAEKITSFPNNCFQSNTSITHFEELQYFKGLTTLPQNCFNGCSNLKTIILPTTVNTLMSSTFNNCTSLEADVFDLSNVITFNGSNNVWGCKKIKSVLLNDNITSLKTNMFAGCTALTTINIPPTIVSIGNGCFTSCNNLSIDLVLGDNTVSIGSQAFYGCKIKSIAIGNGLKTIPDRCFLSNGQLTTVSVGTGITNIGSDAFRYCPKLTSFTIRATEPPTLYSNEVFLNSPNCIFYVPIESVEVYKTATNWSSFASRIRAIPE